ncbi:MAG: beta-propeller fold lactonase family protein [Acidobacteriaceae bacterium]|jgi:6-phosphogluconolactonase (cycloisomerase 2 family)
MNLHKISRIAKVSVVSVAMVLGLASCSLDYTVGYVYMTTNKSNPGLIDQYAIDFDSGALSQIGSPVAAGNNPVMLVASPSGMFVYVLNQADSTVQEFAVQGDGTLASQHVYPITGGTRPTAAAIDPQGAFLYVAFTYQTGYSAATPGPGGVAIFPVNADNSLGTQTTQPVGNNPVAVTASYFNHFVYVLDQEASPKATILGFSQNTTTGALTPVPGTTITTVAGKTVATGFAAGVVPSAIAEEPTSRFLYVTDQAANQLIGYTVLASGGLLPMVNGPFATGLFPSDLTIDPTGKLIYVVNFNGSTVQGYMIDAGTGTPSGAVGAFATGTGTGPTCVAIDPAVGVFLYTSNSLDNTVTGEQLNPNTGGLTAVQNSPFNSSGQPTCLTVVANGSHATQTIVP